MHKQQLGPRAVLVVLDDGTWRFPAHRFFANVPEDDWRPLVRPDPDGKIPVGHNHGLLQVGDELIVVDTGYGDDTHGGCTGHLLEDFERTGWRREQVTKVVTTHGHGDHIKRHTLSGGGRREPTFPQARYYLSRQDWEWFGGPGHVPEFDDQLRSLHEWGRLTLFEAPCRLTTDVQLLPSPGHTPGHTSVLVGSNGHWALLLGDLCHHPLHFSHPDWVSSFDTHPSETPKSRETLFKLAIARDALLLCPHAPSPGLGRLRRRDGGWAWQPVEA
jgi:glyoxylase-like metal-dependent hydrolase (beta-lactamase superfamily II)